MHFVDYEKLKKEMIGESVPNSTGEKSGHTVATPFENLVYSKIKEQIPLKTFRQYEYLNNLYSQSPDITKVKERQALIKSLSVRFLLNRGVKPTKEWSIKKLFEEKQNDTADMIVVKDDFFEIIDIKTKREFAGGGRPPNIISAYKLAQVCTKMIDNNEFDTFTINYFEIDWTEQVNKLVCIDARVVNLFKANPESLYINWTAGKQIQVSLFSIEQNFIGTQKDWAIKYLKHFTTKFKENEINQRAKFLTPFEKYIK